MSLNSFRISALILTSSLMVTKMARFYVFLAAVVPNDFAVDNCVSLFTASAFY